MDKSFYEDIPLSPEEIEEAIKERKIRKFFHERNAPYWQKCDPDLKEKGSQNVVNSPMKIVNY